MENLHFLSRIRSLFGHAFFLSVLLPAPAAGFEPLTKTFGESTHPLLTRETLKRAMITDQQYLQAAADGSIEEDTGPERQRKCFIRAFNHFYDPQHGHLGQAYACRPSLNVFLTSTSWVMSPGSQAGVIPFSFISEAHLVLRCPLDGYPAVHYPDGDQSWPTTLKQLAQGNLVEAYHGLGHALHLVQDAGVPDHARGDDHPAFFEGSIDPSVLEQWAKAPGRVGQLVVLVKAPLQVADPVAAIKAVAAVSSETFYSYSTIDPDACATFPLPMANVREAQVTVDAVAARALRLSEASSAYTYRVGPVKAPGRTPEVSGVDGLNPNETPLCRIREFEMPEGVYRFCFLDDDLVNAYTWRVIGTLAVEAGWGLVNAFRAAHDECPPGSDGDACPGGVCQGGACVVRPVGSLAQLKHRLFCPSINDIPFPTWDACALAAETIPVTQGYLELSPINTTPDNRHAGIDFGGSHDVYSPVSGEVVASTTVCGKVVIADSGDATTRHVFLHMKDIQVQQGDQVSPGTYIGISSNVEGGGCVATGENLHFEIREKYTGLFAVGPTSCTFPGCTTADLTIDPVLFTYP